MPSKKKKYNARFPPARIKKIMQADDEVGKVAAVVPVIISKTLEIFVGTLLRKACQVTKARNARTLTPAHLKASINSENQFSFLREIVSSIPDINTNASDDDPSSATEQGNNNNSSNARVTLSRKASVGASGSGRHFRTRAPRKASSHSSAVAATLSQDEDEHDSPSSTDKPSNNNLFNSHVTYSRKVSVGTSGSGRHLRTRAPSRKVRRHTGPVTATLSQDEDDDADDMDDLDDEDDDEDEGSSCDNSNATAIAVPSSSTSTAELNQQSSTPQQQQQTPLPPSSSQSAMPFTPSMYRSLSCQSSSSAKPVIINKADMVDDDYDNI